MSPAVGWELGGDMAVPGCGWVRWGRGRVGWGCERPTGGAGGVIIPPGETLTPTQKPPQLQNLPSRTSVTVSPSALSP